MRRKPVDIVEMVEAQEVATSALRSRMDDDYSRWRLDPYQDEELDGFRVFTPNEPRTQANKIISLLGESKQHIQINQVAQPREQRDIRNMAERFYLGIFQENDYRLSRIKRPPLKKILSWQIAIRGFFAGRNLLYKQDSVFEPGTPDITPFDPRDCYLEIGATGLVWFIHRKWRTASQIKNEWGVKVKPDLQSNDTKQLIAVYDWYDDEHNGVVLERQVLKKPTEHGSPEFPCFFGAVGSNDMVHTSKSNDTIKDWGESIYQANRQIFDEMAFTQSIRSEFMARSLKRPFVVKSPDGSLSLPENPFLTQGGTTGIALPEGSEIIILDALEMAKEMGLQVGELAGQLQRGGIPWSSFGELQQQLSGFAITQLRQGQQTSITDPVDALTDAYTQITRSLRAQYSTGAFEEMTVSGREESGERTAFKQVIPVEVVRDGGDPEVTFVPELPQDDIQAAAMAIQLRDPGPTGEPIYDDRTIREEVLKNQNADRIGDAVLAQKARRASGLAASFDIMMAAANEGDEQLANIWMGEAQIQMIQKYLELQILKLQAMGLAQAGSGPSPSANGGGGGGGTSPSPTNVDPRVATGGTLGVPPTLGPGQIGPLVAPGTPRPGSFGQFGANGAPGGF